MKTALRAMSAALALFLAGCAGMAAKDVELKLPATDKITILSCFYHRQNVYAFPKSVTEKSLGNGASLTQAFRAQFSNKISDAGYKVSELAPEDNCPFAKDLVKLEEGVTILVRLDATWVLFGGGEDFIVAYAGIKVPGQNRSVYDHKKILNGPFGSGPEEAAQEIAAALLEKIRMAQKITSLPDISESLGGTGQSQK